MILLEYPQFLRFEDWVDYYRDFGSFDQFVISKYKECGVIDMVNDYKTIENGRRMVVTFLQFDTEEDKTMFILKYL